MPTQRQMRVNSLLKEEISSIVLRELPDPELRLTTITSVQASPDLRHARVFASVLGDDEEEYRLALNTLKRHRKEIQALIGDRLDLRYTPRLTFLADHTAEHAQRIETLLGRIAEEPPLPEPPAGTEPLPVDDLDDDDFDDEDEE